MNDAIRAAQVAINPFIAYHCCVGSLREDGKSSHPSGRSTETGDYHDDAERGAARARF